MSERLHVYARAAWIVFLAPAAGFLGLFWKGVLRWLKTKTPRAV